MTKHWESLPRDLQSKRPAMVVLDRLNLDSEDKLNDMALEEREQLYKHLVDLART